MATDEYGREPEYAGTKPGNPRTRELLLGTVKVYRPWPVEQPAFVNDQPVES